MGDWAVSAAGSGDSCTTGGLQRTAAAEATRNDMKQRASGEMDSRFSILIGNLDRRFYF